MTSKSFTFPLQAAIGRCCSFGSKIFCFLLILILAICMGIVFQTTDNRPNRFYGLPMNLPPNCAWNTQLEYIFYRWLGLTPIPNFFFDSTLEWDTYFTDKLNSFECISAVNKYSNAHKIRDTWFQWRELSRKNWNNNESNTNENNNADILEQVNIKNGPTFTKLAELEWDPSTSDNFNWSEYWADFVYAGKPVVIRKLGYQTNVIGKWELEYFNETCGHVKVPVAMHYSIDACGMKYIPFHEIVEDIEKGDEQSTMYSRFGDLFVRIPSLMDYFNINLMRNLVAIPETSDYYTWLMFFSNAQPRTEMHMSGQTTAVVLLQGKKRWFFWMPDQEPYLYPKSMPFNLAARSMVATFDESEWGDKYPMYRYSRGYVVDVNPGDAIFVPAWVWHAVQNIGDVNIAIDISTQKIELSFYNNWMQTLALVMNVNTWKFFSKCVVEKFFGSGQNINECVFQDIDKNGVYGNADAELCDCPLDTRIKYKLDSKKCPLP